MIDSQEILRRRDMRNVFTFTIDPADAKDFDDALSLEYLTDETNPTAQRSYSKAVLQQSGPTAQRSYSEAVLYQIGVHIADVSYYVKPRSKVDDDAYRRGTSVYLVDRVLPMLPEQLCNDLCSLRPGEDKLCMSVIFTMDSDAHVLKHKICRTVIRSDARLDYTEAQQIIKTLSEADRRRIGGGLEATRTQMNAIDTLNRLALKLRAARMAAGAMDIEQQEMRFRLDEKGHPVEIYFEEPNEAHHLIEEFMLLANRTVARDVADLKSSRRANTAPPFVYRVHDKPNEDKLADLEQFRKRMGDRIQPQVLDMLAIRAQAKAVYSTHNIGHYGLAFTHYTHFTSPIRRYPDLMVHRLVDKYILTGKPATWTQEELEDICRHCSECEQEAQQAERESVKMFQAMWMADRIGEIMPGHISGVTDFGLFVQLDDSRCEGLVHISSLPQNGYWLHDEQNYRLVAETKKSPSQQGGDKTRLSFTLGDPVLVRVVRADVNKAQIDFELVNEDRDDRTEIRRKRGKKQ